MPDTQTLPKTAQPISWQAVSQRPAPAPGELIRYGSAPQQFAYLRLPSGPGTFPVVVLIHGGCWLNEFSLDYFEHWAQWLSERGYASWNMEFRRIGDPGGGWPGTFLDISAGIDQLRDVARDRPLDLQDLTVLGHSAGGHLAMWSAMRHTLSDDSIIRGLNPLIPKHVIGLAPIADLAQYRIGPPGSCHSAVDSLMGGTPEQFPDRYRQSSPAQGLPLGIPVELFIGEQDYIVPIDGVRSYVAAARKAGDQIRLNTLPGAGHFDLAVPTAASRSALEAIFPVRDRSSP